MTVNELKKELDKYSGDMNVKMSTGSYIDDLHCVSHGVDMDTNIVSVWLLAERGKE